MGIATGEVLNDFPTSMVLDDQIFGMSVIAQHHLESRREILTSDRVDDDARVLFHLLNRGLLDQEVMESTLSFLTGSNQGRGARHSAPYPHRMQAGDHSRPRSFKLEGEQLQR